MAWRVGRDLARADPVVDHREREWGQLVAGVAHWPTYFGLPAQATAVGGLLVFGIATAWMFGREFADRTAKRCSRCGPLER